MAHEIQNEDDLFEFIKKFQAGELDPSEKLHFDGWPRYEITICGKDFDSSIPTRIIPALTMLQNEINHGYARCLYGKIKHLNKKEKKKAELIVLLKPGSIQLGTQLWRNLNNLVSSLPVEKMTGRQVFWVIIVLAITSNLAWQGYLNSYDRRYKLAQETKHLQILAELAPGNPLVAGQNMDTEATITQFLKALDNEDELTVNGNFITTGRDAQQILHMRSRLLADHELIDGIFVIDQVKYGNRPDHFEIWVSSINLNPKSNLSALISCGTLFGDQIDELQNAASLLEAWEKKTPFEMHIQVPRIGDKTRQGRLLKAKRVDVKKP